MATVQLIGCQRTGNFALRATDAQTEQPAPAQVSAPSRTEVTIPPSAGGLASSVAPIKFMESDEDDILEEGLVIPTIYYTPLIQENAGTCPGEEKVPLLNTNDDVLIRVCPKTEADCSLQGTCYITQNGKVRRFNLAGHFEMDSKGPKHFVEMTDGECRFGFGVQDICLDPFYSVAADLSHYHPGDVIYLPDVKGVPLPDGTRHTGYFVVRDDGPRITGKGRFDFFTGFLNWTNPGNPLARKKLADPATRLPYAVVTGLKAEEARRQRNFPK